MDTHASFPAGHAATGGPQRHRLDTDSHRQGDTLTPICRHRSTWMCPAHSETGTHTHTCAPMCRDRHSGTQTGRCTRAHAGVQRPRLAGVHVASRALVSLPPDDSGSAVPVSRAAAGQPSSDRSDGRAHHCPEEALAASRVSSPWPDGAQPWPSGGALGRGSHASCTAVFSQADSAFPSPWRLALLCPPGSRSLLGTGGRGVWELSVSLGAPGICAGLSGVSACLSVCGSLGTRAQTQPRDPCPIRHGTS